MPLPFFWRLVSICVSNHRTLLKSCPLQMPYVEHSSLLLFSPVIKLSLCYTKRSSTRSFFCLSTRMVSPSADVSIALSAVPAEVEVAGWYLFLAFVGSSASVRARWEWEKNTDSVHLRNDSSKSNDVFHCIPSSNPATEGYHQRNPQLYFHLGGKYGSWESGSR